jgi:hypothetical protein
MDNRRTTAKAIASRVPIRREENIDKARLVDKKILLVNIIRWRTSIRQI